MLAKGGVIGDDLRRASLPSEMKYRAALAKEGLQTGQHQKKVRVGAASDLGNARMVGVTARFEKREQMNENQKPKKSPVTDRPFI